MSRDHNEDGEKRPFDKRGENRDQDKRAGRGEGFKPRERDGERRPREFGARDGNRERGDRERGDRDGKPRFEKKFGDKPRFDKGDAPRGRDAGDRDAPVEEAERIAKRLARAGIASRREAETMIAAGRISVNGKMLTSPAVNVKRSDIIKVDGKLLPQTERTRLWLYHKPSGLVTTNRDPEGRPTVFESLPEDMPRVLSVGRLDINTEGLLLLTNDGGLSRILELPTTGWLRRYRVRAHGSVTQEQLDELKNGIAVDGIFYGSVDAQLERQQGSNVWLNIGLREGKNREVKNILGALGLTVGRLIRVSFGPFQLSDLEVGAVREIRGRTLRDQLGERLVQESGADFDAPIINEFSNSDVRGAGIRAPRGDDEHEERVRRPREWISSSPSQGKPKRAERVEESRRPRGVNVWMAPGARPQSAKAEAAREERNEFQKRERKPFGEGRGGAPRGERSDRPQGDRPFRSNDRDRQGGFERKGGSERQGGFERKPRDGDFTPRPRRSDDEGSFQKRPYGEGRGERSERFDRAPRPEGERRPRAEGDRRPRFDDEKRPGRRERERENAREARRTEDFTGGYSRGEKSRDARPFGDKPRNDRPRGDKPWGDKPRSDKPWGDKPRGDRPQGDRPQGDRPRGDKPYRDGPSGGKPGGRGADRRR